MSKKYLSFAGKDFELVNYTTKEGEAIVDRFEHPWKKYEDIYDAYTYPSKTKVDIWRSWYEWFKTLPDTDGGHYVYAWDMFIVSRNTSAFSISAMCEKGTRLLYFYITRDHAKVVIV